MEDSTVLTIAVHSNLAKDGKVPFTIAEPGTDKSLVSATTYGVNKEGEISIDLGGIISGIGKWKTKYPSPEDEDDDLDDLIDEDEEDDEDREDVPAGLNCSNVIEKSRKHIVPELKVAE